jgi:leader peptidase (prepilin peptidase)/N-methyltransferase
MTALFDYFHASQAALQASPAAFIALTAVLGLLVGSFLNVVIYRLPVMMEREWRAACDEMLSPAGAQVETAMVPEPPFNLITPRSQCPKCKHAITALENIPVLSYMRLKGRCSGCGTHISVRYPSIEALTAALSAIVAWHFGFGWEAGAALFLTWALIALSFIDFDHQLLPDSITLPFLWVGLTLSLFPVYVDSFNSIIGALTGYLSLWMVYMLFKLLTGKEGMGHGDFKLLAMLGAWLGWKSLLTVVVLSSLVGAVVGISLVLLRGRDKNIPIPFGPYLAAAGWITLLWGDDIMQAYLGVSGLG